MADFGNGSQETGCEDVEDLGEGGAKRLDLRRLAVLRSAQDIRQRAGIEKEGGL